MTKPTKATRRISTATADLTTPQMSKLSVQLYHNTHTYIFDTVWTNSSMVNICPRSWSLHERTSLYLGLEPLMQELCCYFHDITWIHLQMLLLKWDQTRTSRLKFEWKWRVASQLLKLESKEMRHAGTTIADKVTVGQIRVAGTMLMGSRKQLNSLR